MTQRASSHKRQHQPRGRGLGHSAKGVASRDDLPGHRRLWQTTRRGSRVCAAEAAEAADSDARYPNPNPSPNPYPYPSGLLLLLGESRVDDRVGVGESMFLFFFFASRA